MTPGLWGMYPVSSRFLQLPPNSVPPMIVLFAMSFGMFIVTLPSSAIALKARLFHGKAAWILGFVTALRAVTNVYATRYSLAVYVQLFALMTPFIVSLLARTWLKEPIPKAFFFCLTTSVAGSFLLLVDDFAHFAFVSMTKWDILGLVMCLVTSCFLALYMIASKVAANQGIPISQGLMIQALCSGIAALLLSIGIPTDWSTVKDFSGLVWAVLLSTAGIFTCGNGINMHVIKKAGPSFNSFFIGVRLFVAILGGWLILGEELKRFWQWIGAAVVLISTTAFLVVQEHERARKRREMTAIALKILPPKAGEAEAETEIEAVDKANSSELALLGTSQTFSASRLLLEEEQEQPTQQLPSEYQQVSGAEETEVNTAGEDSHSIVIDAESRPDDEPTKPVSKKPKKGTKGYQRLEDVEQGDDSD